MAIVLVIATLILIGVLLLVIRKAGGSKPAATSEPRFRHVGPGEPKPEKPRATGLD
jgi:hypothetical protein